MVLRGTTLNEALSDVTTWMQRNRDIHFTVKQLVDAQVNKSVYTRKSQIDMSVWAMILILKTGKCFYRPERTLYPLSSVFSPFLRAKLFNLCEDVYSTNYFVLCIYTRY